MIRVAVIDDHAIVRAGLQAMLAPVPDLEYVGGAAGGPELSALLYRTRPTLVLLGLDSEGQEDVLRFGLQLDREPVAPRMIVLSGSTGSDLTVAALLAGADAVVGKRDTRRALLEAIRIAARGGAEAPEVPAGLRARAAARLEPTDRAILAMRLARTPVPDIAATVGLSVNALTERLAAIITRLLTPGREDDVPLRWLGDAPTLGNGVSRHQARDQRVARTRPRAADAVIVMG